MTVVGESLGAGRKDEAIYYVKKLSIVSEVVIVISCLVMYILVYPITKSGEWKRRVQDFVFIW